MNVGFVGIGNMGGPLARRLLGQVELGIFDLDAHKVDAMVTEGAR